MNEKISVCIIAGNEEENIGRCLQSVTWADEIVVVDSFSHDRTPEIARGYTPHVYQHEWQGYVKQKALAKTYATNPWILFIDADEEVSPELRDEIFRIFSSKIPDDVSGFDFPRKVWFLGRWILHGDWYPDRKLRLFRASRGECTGTEPHDRITVHGKVEHIRSPLYHYTYDNIHQQLDTLDRFSSIAAKSKPDMPGFRIVLRMLFDPPFRFFRCYFVKRGFLDGLPGYIIARAIAFGTFAKYAKIWERRHNRPAPRAEDAVPPA